MKIAVTFETITLFYQKQKMTKNQKAYKKKYWYKKIILSRFDGDEKNDHQHWAHFKIHKYFWENQLTIFFLLDIFPGFSS